MINVSPAYKDAIDAPTRRIVPKALIDLTDPDLSVTSVTGDYSLTYSFPAQLTDRDTEFSGAVYASGEWNRWILDGTVDIMPDLPATRAGEQGVIGDQVGADGETIVVNIAGVDTLQAVTVSWPNVIQDGYPVSLTLNIYSSSLLLYTTTESCSGSKHVFSGFTAIQPTELEVIVEEWSLPDRRYRFVEVLPGVIETWGGETIYQMTVIQKADFSNLTIPYASASIEIENVDKRFDPSNKEGVFLSVVARQPIPLFYGVEVNHAFEYCPVGVFYQQNEGWSIENDGLTIRWDLVDIIGLLVDRKFELKGTQPTTLSGWISEIVGQLGSTFAGHYSIDVAEKTLTCSSSAITDITCGDLLRFVCQASNTFPVSDPESGYLHIKSLDNVPQDRILMRSQNSVAGSKSNTDIAFLVFDIGGVQYSVAGTEEISDKTVTIKNPFIGTTAAAIEASQVILTQYGGNVIDLKVRGDMSREIGDVETVEVTPGVNVAARILEQQLTLSNGIMTNVPLRCLQANGGELYTDVILITESGTYTMPAGVTQITLVLIGGGQGGQGGQGGTDGIRSKDGQGGAGGVGGKVYSTPLTINDGQQIDIVIGQGGLGSAGTPIKYVGFQSSDPYPAQSGALGTPTTATLSTTFSSENGIYMPTGYADLLTGKTFGVPGANGRNGSPTPKAGANAKPSFGYGGSGGDGGQGATYDYDDDLFGQPTPDGGIYSGWYRTGEAKAGAKGGNGGSGAVLIFYAR